jgi:putative FmdB family regulatory protein
MPIYEYECSKCGDMLEVMQGFHDAPLKKCEKCGGKLHKLVSESAFHLKGSGWYVTDYSRSTRPGARKENRDSKDAKDNSNGGSAGKDSKDSPKETPKDTPRDSKDSKSTKESKDSKGPQESQSSKSATA